MSETQTATSTSAADTNQGQTTTSTSTDAGTGAAAGAAAAATQAYYESFANEQLRTNPAVQKFPTPEALAEGYVNLEKRFGVDPTRRIDLPADMTDAAAMREVWTKLGAPETAEGYKLIDSLPATATEHDKAIATELQKSLFEAGVPAGFTPAIVKFMNEQTAKLAEAQQAMLTQQRTEGEALLKKEWGAAYDQRGLEIGRLLNEYADPELKAELEDPTKRAQHPQLSKFIGKLLDRMAEPGTGGPVVPPPDGGVQLTPSQARAAVTALEADPVKGKAVFDKDHPMHAQAIAERNRLLAMAEGAKPAA